MGKGVRLSFPKIYLETRIHGPILLLCFSHSDPERAEQGMGNPAGILWTVLQKVALTWFCSRSQEYIWNLWDFRAQYEGVTLSRPTSVNSCSRAIPRLVNPQALRTCRWRWGEGSTREGTEEPTLRYKDCVGSKIGQINNLEVWVMDGGYMAVHYTTLYTS